MKQKISRLKLSNLRRICRCFLAKVVEAGDVATRRLSKKLRCFGNLAGSLSVTREFSTLLARIHWIVEINFLQQ